MKDAKTETLKEMAGILLSSQHDSVEALMCDVLDELEKRLDPLEYYKFSNDLINKPWK